eukprot:Awhi_evm1s485
MGDRRYLRPQPTTNKKSQAPEAFVLLNEQSSIPSQLTTDYLLEKYGDKVVPLEINSSKSKSVQLKKFLKFEKDSELNKLYLRNLHLAEWFPQ